MSPIGFCEHLAIYVSTSCCIYEELSPDGVRKGKNNKVVLQLPKISTQGCFSTVFSAGQPTYCKPHKKNFFSKLFNRFRSTQANHTKFGTCFGLLLFFRKMLWYPDVDKKCCCLLSHISLVAWNTSPSTKTLALIQSLNLLFDYLNLLISELI